MRRTRFAISLLVVALLLMAVPWQAGAQSLRYYPETGFTVTNSSQHRFLSEFDRLGGVNAFGYPISNPFESEGFVYQAFQRAVLQWRPEVGQAYLANTMDWLSDYGRDSYLWSLGIPLPAQDSGGSWQRVVAERESWLIEPAIAAAYRAGGGYNRYGLPASLPEQSGPYVVQRFQRYAFQLWVEDVPGMPARGSVVGTLAGALVAEAGIIPAWALVPGEPGSTTPPPPSYQWSYRGSGSQELRNIATPGYWSVVHLTHWGHSRFAVEVHAGTDRQYLVNEFGSYSGSRPWVGDDPVTFHIEADGEWTLRFEAIEPGGQPAFAGRGDSVSKMFDPPSTEFWQFRHDGESNFIVIAHCYGEDWNLVENSIGWMSTTDVVGLAEGPCFWEVIADGNWSLTPL